MYIANPIYDVVFSYLMQDSKIAKLIISSIINEDVTKLSFQSEKLVANVEGKLKKNRQHLTVYRLDFKAEIKTKEGGTKLVLIEIQKAKFPTDIIRFRKYLGENLSSKENIRKVKIKNRYRKVGIPIVCIYFLGHSLDYTDASVIGVNRNYTDLITGKPIKEKESFIESLSHDSYVIQIPKLSQKRRTDLEILLSVFDQSNSIDSSSHILNINEKDYPEKYRPLIRCLQKAVLDPEVTKTMDLEDGIIDELEDMQRDIDELREGKAKERQRADAEMQRAENLEKEKEQVEKEKEQVEKEKEQVEKEKERIEKEKEEEKKSAILRAVKRGKLSIEEIAEDFRVSAEYVRKLL
jgi:hypothetical protein